MMDGPAWADVYTHHGPLYIYSLNVPVAWSNTVSIWRQFHSKDDLEFPDTVLTAALCKNGTQTIPSAPEPVFAKYHLSCRLLIAKFSFGPAVLTVAKEFLSDVLVIPTVTLFCWSHQQPAVVPLSGDEVESRSNT